MDIMRKTGVVIPCYNEAKRLDTKSFLTTLEDQPELSFLFVDDGSTDGTLQVLNSIKEQNLNRIDILHLEQNSGKAEAVRRGILKLIDGEYENVGYWDADLATPLEAIAEFCQLLDSTDRTMVIGSRVRLLGRRVERNALRHYVGRIFATCASLLLQVVIYDTQCGAKMFRNSDALRNVFGKPFKVNWTFDVEMLARFPLVSGVSPAQLSARWYEYPLKEWIDVKGSKVKLKDFFIGGLEFCTLFGYLHTPARKRYEKYLAGSE
jgi:glycosyltransferase involved in cell wall biosynthesis